MWEWGSGWRMSGMEFEGGESMSIGAGEEKEKVDGESEMGIRKLNRTWLDSIFRPQSQGTCYQRRHGYILLQTANGYALPLYTAIRNTLPTLLSSLAAMAQHHVRIEVRVLRKI